LKLAQPTIYFRQPFRDDGANVIARLPAARRDVQDLSHGTQREPHGLRLLNE
jgi:hypothetical protein